MAAGHHQNTVSGPLRTPKMEMAKMLEIHFERQKAFEVAKKFQILNFLNSYFSKKKTFYIIIFSILLLFSLLPNFWPKISQISLKYIFYFSALGLFWRKRDKMNKNEEMQSICFPRFPTAKKLQWYEIL